MNLLVNLPRGFFETAELRPVFERLARRAELRCRSHDHAAAMAEDVRWADAVIMWAWPVLDDALLASAERLRFVGHVNATQAQARAELARGLAVSEARRGFSAIVAELALGLMLCGLRRISSHHAAMRDGNERWTRDFPREVDPQERSLFGRRVGVVGLGGIGQQLAELLRPFRVELSAYDPFLPLPVAERCGARLVTLDELAETSEVVVLAAADNAGSAGSFSRRHVDALPLGALLVNVGRASLLDSQALLERLQRGEIAAALDVFEQEPLPADHPLRALPNAWLTPHRGATRESAVRVLGMLADDLEAFLDGRPRAHALEAGALHALHG